MNAGLRAAAIRLAADRLADFVASPPKDPRARASTEAASRAAWPSLWEKIDAVAQTVAAAREGDVAPLQTADDLAGLPIAPEPPAEPDTDEPTS